jgi:hypothetical protein
MATTQEKEQALEEGWSKPSSDASVETNGNVVFDIVMNVALARASEENAS